LDPKLFITDPDTPYGSDFSMCFRSGSDFQKVPDPDSDQTLYLKKSDFKILNWHFKTNIQRIPVLKFSLFNFIKMVNIRKLLLFMFLLMFTSIFGYGPGSGSKTSS
jgi:hypothetical protein